MDSILRPHLKILGDLLHNPNSVPIEDSPVLEYVSTGGDGRDASGTVSHVGNLTVSDRARVSNWFVENIPNAAGMMHQWIGRAPLAHAFTLLIASRARAKLMQDADIAECSSSAERERLILKSAWKMQRSDAGELWHDVDVDKECVAAFEERIFETSKRAGMASYFQWGLDAGDHQDAWYPYGGRPSDWHYQDLEGSDSDLQVGFAFPFSLLNSSW